MISSSITEELDKLAELKGKVSRNASKEHRSRFYKRIHTAEKSLKNAADQLSQVQKVVHLL